MAGSSGEYVAESGYVDLTRPNIKELVFVLWLMGNMTTSIIFVFNLILWEDPRQSQKGVTYFHHPPSHQKPSG